MGRLLRYHRTEDDRSIVSHVPDLEKNDYEDQSSSEDSEHEAPLSSYSDSSRETSGSYKPMLSKPSSRREKTIKFYRPPSRRTIRYLCFAIFMTLIIFIMSLIRASWASSKQLEMGPVEKQGPIRPPPWEEFPFLTRYFGGLRSLIPREENVPEFPSDTEPESAPKAHNETINVRAERSLPKSLPYDPYPAYSSSEYKAAYAEKHECFLDMADLVQIPHVHHYVGVPKGFPDAVIGSHNVLGLRDDICFERYGRLGPYGYGYSTKGGGSGAGLEGERQGADDMWTRKDKVPEVDYTKFKWADAQRSCLEKNQKRFTVPSDTTSLPKQIFSDMEIKSGTESLTGSPIERRRNSSGSMNTQKPRGPQSSNNATMLPRTAVVIRTWWNRQYSLEDIIYLRSMITELSLLSGGEYTVQFLVHVKDDTVPIWADQQIYDRVLENSLPEEFRGMGVLWSEKQMSLIYAGLQETMFRDLPVHGVYRGLYLALQYFSIQHPEYEYVWNWEMDVRYTGQWYHLFDRVQKWTKNEPRKGLWERNGRFYIPSEHGSWEDFKQMVRINSEMGTASTNNIWSGLKAGGSNTPGSPRGKTDTPVWGPDSPSDMLKDQDDPMPPTSAEKDKYDWGVGEEADLISFSPLFDPDGTTWFYVEDVTGYNTSEGLPPRRAAIGTSVRISRRLLQTMHRETIIAQHHMFSEMWPASIALQHGYKAVYAPHPVYIDRRWPTKYLASVMNGGRNGASGGARTSVYGGREHNFKGQTWFYDAGFSPNLWRRWLGYKIDNDGGEQEEIAGEGRMCLPGMLLHPVKGVDMVVEGAVRHDHEEIEAAETGADSELDWEDTR